MKIEGLNQLKIKEFVALLPDLSDFDKIRLIDAIREHLPPKVWKENFE